MPNNQPPPSPSQATPSTSTMSPRRATGSAQSILGELVACISGNISTPVCGEIDLARAKGQRMAKEMGSGAGLLAAARVLVLFIFGLVLGTLATGLSHAMPPQAAFLMVALVLAFIAMSMTLIGIKRLKAAKADTPTSQKGLKESVNAVKEIVTSGLQRGNAR